jgi:hypothetical protein
MASSASSEGKGSVPALRCGFVEGEGRGVVVEGAGAQFI